MSSSSRLRKIIAVQVFACLVCLFPISVHATIVRLQTVMGVIDIQLLDNDAPITVSNFLNYVDAHAYDDSFVHRSVPGFVIQGGGYVWDNAANSVNAVATNAPIINEFDPAHSNLRGTVAMAKLGGDPNSATSQWFINLADNSGNLDNQNGGFTVFGTVLAKGMDVADAIAGLQRVNAGGAFTQLPLATPLAGNVVTGDNLVILQSVSSGETLVTATDSDRIFAFLEAIYPEYLAPANPLSPTNSGSNEGSGYYYRYYASTNAYIGTYNGQLYYLGSASNNALLHLGSVSDWLSTAIEAGY